MHASQTPTSGFSLKLEFSPESSSSTLFLGDKRQYFKHGVSLVVSSFAPLRIAVLASFERQSYTCFVEVVDSGLKGRLMLLLSAIHLKTFYQCFFDLPFQCWHKLVFLKSDVGQNGVVEELR